MGVVSERLSSSIMKVFWTVFVLLVTAAITCVMWFGIRTSPTVSFRIVSRTNDVAGNLAVLVQVTNASPRAFTCTYQTQVQANGFWTTPVVVLGMPPRSAIGTHSLPGRSAFEVRVPAPASDMKWRVMVFYNEPPGTVRARMDGLLQRVGLPVSINRKIFVIGQELSS